MPPESAILVVDDEESIRRFLKLALQDEGYRPLEASSGQEAVHCVRQHSPDAVLLDFGLPDFDGIEVTRRLRSFSWVPIVFVSVCEDQKVKVQALDAGADDYLCKPFGLEELLARLRAALRRKHVLPESGLLRCGEVELHQDQHLALVRGERVSLTPNEYQLLRALMQNPGKLISHSYLLRLVWGPGYEQEMHMLRVNLSNLRRKLDAPRHILNEPGIGYRIVDPGQG